MRCFEGRVSKEKFSNSSSESIQFFDVGKKVTGIAMANTDVLNRRGLSINIQNNYDKSQEKSKIVCAHMKIVHANIIILGGRLGLLGLHYLKSYSLTHNSPLLCLPKL